MYATREAAVAHEIRLHGRFNVKAHPPFFNRANQVSEGYTLGPLTENLKKQLSAGLKTYYAQHPERVTVISERLKQRNLKPKEAFALNRRGAHHSNL